MTTVDVAHSQITIYGISALEMPTTTSSVYTPIVSATTNFYIGGVNTEGATTVVEEIIYSLVVVTNPTSTSTVISKLDTGYVTLVAGPSGIQQTVSGQDGYVKENCTFGSDELGTCVIVYNTASPSQTATPSTTTVSGTVVPIFTITSTHPLPTSSATSGATALLGAPRLHLISLCATACIIISTSLYVLMVY